MKNILLLVVLTVAFQFASSQEKEVLLHRLTTENGLPSNHVYYSIKDRNGYLWIATSRGVVKYNGYQCKVFAKEDGIENEDVWHLYEDKRDRIWLSSISHKMGYILDNQYHEAVSEADVRSYPFYIKEYEKGIYFIGINPNNSLLCFEKNDTIHTFKTTPLPVYTHSNGFIIQSGNTLETISIVSGKIKKRKTTYPLLGLSNCLYKHYLIPMPFQSTEKNLMNVINIDDHTTASFKLEDNERIFTHYESGEDCYLSSNKHIYKLTERMEMTKVSAIDQLLFQNQIKENDFLTYMPDSLWGDRITTKSNGLLLLSSGNDVQLKSSNLSNAYKYIGVDNLKHYFWDRNYRKLVVYDKGNRQQKAITLPPSVQEIYKIISYSVDSNILFTNDGIAWISKNNTLDYWKVRERKLYINVTDGFLKTKTNLYLITTSLGLVNAAFSPNSDIQVKQLDSLKYIGIVYDSIRKVIVGYGKNHLCIQGQTRKMNLNIDPQYGSIEKICLDRWGNGFFHIGNNLFFVDMKRRVIKRLFENINLKSSFVFLDNDKLIAAGTFGIAYCSVISEGKFSRPQLIENRKRRNYTFVNDAYMLDSGQLILNTDKGVLEWTYLEESKTISNAETATANYILTIGYNKKTSSYNEKDSLTIYQTNPTIHFDLINPAGSGEVKYRYKIGDYTPKWSYLSGNELLLPKLQPGKTHTLYLQANDDILRTKIIKIQLYVIPYWWQTIIGKMGIAIVTFLGLSMLIAIVVRITKQREKRRNEGANLKLELKNLNQKLELKSIYAQLDPHFIFNTLNTGLYFIKKKKTDEAYNHFVSFSQLLRAYIKSSRNKFLPLSEEIENLTKYVKLQQARFYNKFDFKILVDDALHVEQIKLPTLLLQPFVENAINHGLSHKEDKGLLVIEFKKGTIKEQLICIIDDDGIGRVQARAIKEASKVSHISYGNDLIKELIELINKEAKMHITLEYIDKALPLEGTTVIITINKATYDS